MAGKRFKAVAFEGDKPTACGIELPFTPKEVFGKARMQEVLTMDGLASCRYVLHRGLAAAEFLSSSLEPRCKQAAAIELCSTGLERAREWERLRTAFGPS